MPAVYSPSTHWQCTYLKHVIVNRMSPSEDELCFSLGSNSKTECHMIAYTMECNSLHKVMSFIHKLQQTTVSDLQTNSQLYRKFESF